MKVLPVNLLLSLLVDVAQGSRTLMVPGPLPSTALSRSPLVSPSVRTRLTCLVADSLMKVLGAKLPIGPVMSIMRTFELPVSRNVPVTWGTDLALAELDVPLESDVPVDLGALADLDVLAELVLLELASLAVALSARSMQLLHRWADARALVVGVMTSATVPLLVLLPPPVSLPLSRVDIVRPMMQLRTLRSRPVRLSDAAAATPVDPNFRPPSLEATLGISPVYPPNGARRERATLLDGANTVIVLADRAMALLLGAPALLADVYFVAASRRFAVTVVVTSPR